MKVWCHIGPTYLHINSLLVRGKKSTFKCCRCPNKILEKFLVLFGELYILCSLGHGSRLVYTVLWRPVNSSIYNQFSPVTQIPRKYGTLGVKIHFQPKINSGFTLLHVQLMGTPWSLGGNFLVLPQRGLSGMWQLSTVREITHSIISHNWHTNVLQIYFFNASKRLIHTTSSIITIMFHFKLNWK